MRAKLRDILRQGEIVLKERGIEDYRNDAYCILNKHFNVNRAQILLTPEEEYPDEAVLGYWEDVRQRGDRKPLQHILGSWDFMGFPFIVNPDVLIPRPETEWLVEYVAERYRDRPLKVLDLCTGSGCIGIAIKKLLPQAEVTLVDVSELALKVAKQNAEALEAEVKIERWDILQGVPFFMKKLEFDVIVSNPPYIKSEELAELQAEVQQEPELALDGGPDGLLYYRALAKDWSALLKEGGELLVETGEDTGVGVQVLFEEVLPGAALHNDLSGLPRYVAAKK